MKKIDQFQITDMTISGFKSYQQPTTLNFGELTTVTGGNGQGKTSIADAIAFAVTGLPFFGKRGIDRLYNEVNPDVSITLRFIDQDGAPHELTRTRRKDQMAITYDGYAIRQMDLNDMFGERDVFLSIFNPLYFIEELGDSGKNLLERYLPMISHEEVLAELSEPVRLALQEEQIGSPDVYLKKRREEIRELEESIIYLTGQKDLAATQGQNNTQKVEAATQQLTDLQAELTALEEKQYAGMDVPAMRERLVELSGRYDEMATDSQADAAEHRKKVQKLREKIARRQGEQYQSKFAAAIAEAEATVKALGNQYRKEKAAFETFAPGVTCPTCRRPITEDALPQVQAELKKSAAALLEAGRAKQAEITQLRELDEQSRATFEQFKADDIKKWEAEVAELEQSKDSGTDSTQLSNLRAEIEGLTADLDYGCLTPQEYDRMNECRELCKQTEAELAALKKLANQEPMDYDTAISNAKAQIEEKKALISNVVLYLSKRAELTFSKLKMNRVAISLYDVVKTTGEVKDAFKFTYGGRQYDRLSLSEKIRAGMEVSELMKRLTGRNYPVFVDNMESVDDLANVKPTGQVIMARCVKGAALSVRPVGQPQAMPKAA